MGFANKRRRLSLKLLQHAPGEDVYGHEDAGERWLPVHTVESVVSDLSGVAACQLRAEIVIKLLSVISLLSQEVPDLSSPANVDAAKEVREDLASQSRFNIEKLPLADCSSTSLQEEGQAIGEKIGRGRL